MARIDDGTFDLSMCNDGVYGIFVDDECVYIGSTQTTFAQRRAEHWMCIISPSQAPECMRYKYEWLYKQLVEGKTLEFRPLLSFDSDHKCSIRHTERREYQIAEWALIQTYKPILNIQGRAMDFYIDDPTYYKDGGLK